MLEYTLEKSCPFQILGKSLRLPTNFHDTSNLLYTSMVWKCFGNLLEVEISMIWGEHDFSSDKHFKVCSIIVLNSAEGCKVVYTFDVCIEFVL